MVWLHGNRLGQNGLIGSISASVSETGTCSLNLLEVEDDDTCLFLFASSIGKALPGPFFS